MNNALPQFVPPLTVDDGTITAMATFGDNLLTSAVEDMVDLVELAREGDVYVNFHTVKFPAGVMRGQLQELPCDSKRFSMLESMSL